MLAIFSAEVGSQDVLKFSLNFDLQKKPGARFFWEAWRNARAPGEEKGGVIDPPSYDLQIYERKYEKDIGEFENGGDTC